MRPTLKIFLGLGSAAIILWDIPAIGRVLLKGLAIATTFDFFYERNRDPTWIGSTLNFVLNPPPGTALLVAITGLVLIYWTTKPKSIRMSAPVLGMLAGALLLAASAVWYLVAHQTIASNLQINPDADRARAVEERDAKSIELAAARQEIQDIRLALKNAQTPQTYAPPLQGRNVADLSPEEKRKFVMALHSEVRPYVQQVFIARSTVQPYSQDLGVMSNLFEGSGIKALTGVRSPDNPGQTGLMIGVKQMNDPPLVAKRIKELFLRFGISSNYSQLAADDAEFEGFQIFIGSNAW